MVLDWTIFPKCRWQIWINKERRRLIYAIRLIRTVFKWAVALYVKLVSPCALLLHIYKTIKAIFLQITDHFFFIRNHLRIFFFELCECLIHGKCNSSILMIILIFEWSQTNRRISSGKLTICDTLLTYKSIDSSEARTERSTRERGIIKSPETPKTTEEITLLYWCRIIIEKPK